MARAAATPHATLAPPGAQAVPETRFGVWFQRTELWRRTVLGETLEQLLRLLPDPAARFERVLDAGCGVGFAFAPLRRRFAPRTLIGIDSDAALVAQASRGPAADARLGDLRALAFPDASFDLVLCHQTLHHVAQQERVLVELRRVLAPGGVLLLAESCLPFVRLWWVRAFFRHPAEIRRSASDYVVLVRAAGFSVDDAHVALPDPWWGLPDLGLLRSLGRRVAAHPIVCLAATRAA